jgi:hypothetical protein
MVFASPGEILTCAMTAFLSLANLALTGMDALIVVFLVRTIWLSSDSAGLVVGSFGVGGVAGAIAARPMGRRFGTAWAMLIADAGGLSRALLLPLAAHGPRLAFASAAMMCAACGIVIGNVIGVSSAQTYVPPDILGRVSSATRAAAFAAMPSAGSSPPSSGYARPMDTHRADRRVRHLRDLPQRPATIALSPSTSGHR